MNKTKKTDNPKKSGDVQCQQMASVWWVFDFARRRTGSTQLAEIIKTFMFWSILRFWVIFKGGLEDSGRIENNSFKDFCQVWAGLTLPNTRNAWCFMIFPTFLCTVLESTLKYYQFVPDSPRTPFLLYSNILQSYFVQMKIPKNKSDNFSRNLSRDRFSAL